MQQKILPYTSVFIKLLKGPVDYTERSTWEKLLQYKSDLSSFLQPLGLKLILSEEDGYSYVQHIGGEEDDASVSWIVRRALTYEESILLVLLRDMMAEFEISDSSSQELIKKRREIKEYAELFFKENASRVKFLKDIDRLIDKAEEYGFLALAESSDVADEQRFRIKKIIKARIGSEELEAFMNQLKQRKAVK
ncbi:MULTISPECIES: DUF4194 domain-containing protein [unclassified Paraflavitalea]|uniref:DUF4194 domain-containing protein n=1 Tax=unclassified Paraflavitalea TaxID=2798305 RepID=UPI003D352750